MYRRHISQLRPGQVGAPAIYTERREILLGAGSTLNQFFIEKLRDRGIISVFLRDGLGDDIPPNDMVSEELRASTVTHLARAFDVMSTMATGTRQNNRDRPQTVDDLVYRLGERPLDLPQAGINTLQALYKDIESLMNEILESNTIASLESLKTHNDYTLQHSVDVSVLGILLGQTAGLPRDQLRELALGCLLHDLGKMYINEAILDKPGRLTTEEFDEIKKHPQMGFELIRRMPVFSILPAHVAFQHHERQDGRVSARPHWQQPAGTHPLGADEPEADAADRRDCGGGRCLQRADLGPAVPAAMPLDKVAQIIGEMSGPHLNSDVVSLLLHTIPMFPVGHWVEMVTGKYRGWRGVVTELSVDALHQPVIRLLLDERGDRVPTPVEIDLRIHYDLKIKGLAPGEAPFELSVPV